MSTKFCTKCITVIKKWQLTSLVNEVVLLINKLVTNFKNTSLDTNNYHKMMQMNSQSSEIVIIEFLLMRTDVIFFTIIYTMACTQ